MDPITKWFIIFIVPFGIILAILMRLDLVMHLLGRRERQRQDELRRRQSESEPAAGTQPAPADAAAADGAKPPAPVKVEKVTAKSQVPAIDAKGEADGNSDDPG